MSSPRLDELQELSVDDLPELVTVDELQKVLRVGRSTAYQIARRLRVPIELPDENGKSRTSRILRVRRTDVERLVRGEPERPAALRAVR